MVPNYIQHLILEISVYALLVFTGTCIWRGLSLLSTSFLRFRPGPTLLLLIGLWAVSVAGLGARLLGPISKSPVLPLLAGALMCIGLAAWFKTRRSLPGVIRSRDWRCILPPVLLFLPFSTGRWGWDAGLYHISKGMQFADVDNITGLALINTRFGFNPLTDIWHSMLLASDAGFFGIYLLNDVLLAVLAVFILEMLWESRSRISVCFVGVFALAFALSGGTVNFLDRGMSDFASLVLISVGYVSLFVMLLQNSRQSGVESDTVLRAFLTGVIATIMACLVKMNAAPLAVFFLVWWLANVMKGRFLKSGLALAGPALLIATLWLYTNFLISGCLIYPASFTCGGANNPSAVDLNAVRYESMLTITHARAPVTEPPLEFIRLGNRPDWYLAWWDMNKGSLFTWSIIFGSTVALLVCLPKILRRFRFPRDFGTGSSPGDRRIEDAFCLIGLALLLHTAFWWLLAPSPRYAMYLPLIWLAFGVTVIAVVLANKVQDSGNNLLQRAVIKPAVARWLPVVGVFALGLLLFNSDALLRRPPAVPEAQTVLWTSPAGMNVNLAFPDIRCWAAAIPCTNALLHDWGDRIDYSPERGYFLHPGVAAVEP